MPCWTLHVARGWAIVSLVAASLSLSPTPTAHAAMTLTASPTEVIVITKSQKKTTTLTWNSGSSESVQVFYRVDDNTFAPTGLSGPSGSGQSPELEYDHSYVFRLYSASGQPLQSSPTVVIVVKYQPPKLNFGCALQCIKTLDVTPQGTYADVLVETTVDATILLRVSDDPPNADGSCKSSGNVGFEWITKVAKGWGVHFKDLQPATKHCLTVIARDTSGNEDIQYKTFTTHKRHVKVFFDSIYVLHDGDDGEHDPGEIWFKFWINGQVVGGVGQHNIMSFATFIPNVGPTTLITQSDTVEIKVFGRDEDPPFGEWDAASATLVLQVADPGKFKKPGQIEDFKGTYQLDVMGPSLKFIVYGRHEVWYTP